MPAPMKMADRKVIVTISIRPKTKQKLDIWAIGMSRSQFVENLIEQYGQIMVDKENE